jgi:hypothetical protein
LESIIVVKKKKRTSAKADERARMRELALREREAAIRTAVELALASPVLTIRDAATFARIPASQIRALAVEGRLGYVNKMGKSWLVERASLEAILAQEIASDSDAKRERRERFIEQKRAKAK